jgi:hypothetical protein
MKIHDRFGNIKYDFPECKTLEEAINKVLFQHNGDLTDADMTGAVMRRADMTGADMTGAVMTDAVMTGDKIDGFYKYDALWFYGGGKYSIHFGCKRLLATDWTNNFWNNDNEFPNDGSEKTMNRVILFKEIVRRIELDAKKNNRVTDELRDLFDYDLKEVYHEL